jgi:hypothetical protein
MAIYMLLSSTQLFAQIKNVKTETVKIYGNCGMCKTTIEKAGNIKNIALVDWDKEAKMATITYNSKKTTQTDILKRIALAGYDSDQFLAPDNAYNGLMDCCKYERTAKIAVKTDLLEKSILVNEKQNGVKDEPAGQSIPMNKKSDEHAGHTIPMEKKADEHASHAMPIETKKKADQMQSVFNSYFEVKDALVSTNASAASEKGANFVSSLKAVKMNELSMDVHMIWMKVMKELESDAQKIASSKKIENQRKALIPITKNIYTLMKVAKTDTPTYYQFCPMANGGKGANWLSKENEVKNPYYGSLMMSCGSTLETLN